MRVLWVSTFPPRRCGIGDYAADLASRLVKLNDIHLRILTYPDGLEEAVTQEDGFQLSRTLGRRPVAAYVRSEVETFKPDLVHLQSSSFLHSPRVNRGVERECRMPLVTTVHDTPRSWRLFYTIPSLRKVYTRSRRILVHSTAVSRTLSGFHGIDPEKIVKIPHGVDVDKYSPTASKEQSQREYGLKGSRILLFFGFLRPGKGVERLLQAWSVVEKSNPDSTLVIAGSTPTKAKRYFFNLSGETNYPLTLRRLAKSLGIEDRVKFTGYVPSELVPGLFASAEVIVLPYEGPFSQSGPLHKALGSGRALIASKVPGSNELLEDGTTALLTPPGDSRSLANAIQRVLSDERLSGQLARNARRLAEETLDWSVVAKMTAELYREAVEGD